MLHTEMELTWSPALPALPVLPADLSVDESSSQAEYVIRTNFAALYRELNEPIRTASSNLRLQQQQQQQQQNPVRMPPHHHHYHHHHRHIVPVHPQSIADASYQQQVQPPHPHHPLTLPLSPHPHDYEAHRHGLAAHQLNSFIN